MNTKSKILIVDDDPMTAKTLSKILERRGYGTSVAYSGREAMESTASRCFDCVITDIHMPDVNGVELVRYLTKKWPQSAAILMTGYAPYSLIQEGLDSGAKAVLEKPLNIKELLDLVAALCQPVSPEKSSQTLRRNRSWSLSTELEYVGGH